MGPIPFLSPECSVAATRKRLHWNELLSGSKPRLLGGRRVNSHIRAVFFPREDELEFILSLLFLGNVLGLDKQGMSTVLQSNILNYRHDPCSVNNVCMRKAE